LAETKESETFYCMHRNLTFKPCISELAATNIDVSATDPYGDALSYFWEALDGGQISGTGESVTFTPPESDAHACPYAEALSRDDVEVFESLSGFIQLPQKGMQVHAEYTLYGHFFFLKKLFSGIEKVRFFLDQDSGMRAACLGAFQPEIQERRCDAFYVRINSKMTVPQRQKALENSRNEFCRVQKMHPELSKNEVKLFMIKQRIASMVEFGKWKDKWLEHPFPDMSEPEKSICYLTDYSDYDEDHLAWLYNKASLSELKKSKSRQTLLTGFAFNTLSKRLEPLAALPFSCLPIPAARQGQTQKPLPWRKVALD